MASEARIIKAIGQMKAHYAMNRGRWLTEVGEAYADELRTWPDTVIDLVMGDVLSSEDLPTIAALRRMASAHRPPSRTTWEPLSNEKIATPAEAKAALRQGLLDHWYAKHGDEPLPANLDDLPGGEYVRILSDPVKRAKALATYGDRDPFADY